MSRTVRIGIGGAIGCGKTELIEKLVPKLTDSGLKVGAISNDVYSKEDARRLAARLGKNINPNLIVGIETGGCPHTAVRDDPSMNIDAAERLERENPTLDIILIESGGDNITLTFSPRLADFFIYMVDVAGGDKTIRKGGLGIKKADLLLINKIDLAPYVESTILESGVKTGNLDLMKEDAKKLRGDKPTVLLSLKDGNGLDEVIKIVMEKALFK
ncbi:MAG TPA: urease accessory protein UreG [Candidatus Limnocylindrales bacterium]|nr:urease accessory protein UreG [Candidatus Limnocylindrales bacterium]